MPAISKIRLCNVIYENGGKRYNDQLFHFDGQNAALLLENGGGKTVFIQSVLQCVIPHINMADRKIKDTLSLEQGPAHMAIEWILSESPRRYGLTCVSLYRENNQLNSLKYTYEYSGNDDHTIEDIPFKVAVSQEAYRPSTRGEISEYYQRMAKNNPYAKVFTTINDYGKHLEQSFKIIPSEWRKVAVINSGEGNVDEYFSRCKTTEQLLNNLLIPVVEEAIEGDSSTEFAKTFEKQRDHFKKNRILHDKIEQSQGVKEQIDSYVSVYKKYNYKLEEVRKLKGKAKRVTELIEEQLEHIETGKADIIASRDQLLNDQKNLDNQKLTYQILLCDRKIEEKSKDLDGVSKKLEAIMGKKDKVAARRQNIQLSKVIKLKEELEQELKRLTIELEDEEKKLPTGDLILMLEENSSNIKGHFEYEIEKLKLELNKRREDLDRISETRDDLSDKLDLVKTKELTGKEKLIKCQTAIEFCKREMDEIYDQLFDSDIGRSVDEHLADWTYDFKNLQQKLLAIANEKLDVKANLDNLQTERQGAIDEVNALNKQIKDINMTNQRIDHISRKLLVKVNEEGLKISSKDLIYTKEESMKTLLKERLAYLAESRANLLNEEMIYKSKEMLKDVVNPSILNLYRSLKEEIDYISLGKDYMVQLSESMDLDLKELLERFPFFAMTLVTNRQSKDKLQDLLIKHNKDLTVPVFLMTIEDLSLILKSENQEESLFLDNAVIPSLWNDSLTLGYLESHNELIAKKLVSIREERKSLDLQWAGIKHLITSIDEFFDLYSYEDYIKNRDLKVEHEKEIDKIRARIKDLDEEISQSFLRAENLADDETVKRMELEKLGLNIDLATAYEGAYHKYLNLREEEESLQNLVSDYIYERKDLSFDLSQLNTQKLKLMETLKEFEYEIRKLNDHALYREVIDSPPICTNKDINHLINERRSLRNKIAGLSVSREAISMRIDQQMRLYNHYESQLLRLEKEKEYPYIYIDTSYESEEDDLFDEIVGLKGELRNLEVEFKKEEKARWSLETKKNLLLNDLKTKSMTMVDFNCDLAYIPTRIKIFEGTVKDLNRKILYDEKRFNKEFSRYNKMMTELRIKDGSYSFLGEDSRNLSKKDKDNLDKEPEHYINDLFKALANHNGILKALRYDVKESKEQVVEFCREYVDDYRLKEAVVNGLVEKSDYKELLIYQERMTDIINRTIQLANDDKRESDTELLTFLSHLLTYVKTVISELSVLQKKTMIELDTGNKQIFIFDIPDYHDEQAKEAMRLYIDQMIELFEEENDLDEDSIRQLIEDRLNVKNLIGIVLGHLPIKIKCRKVTNDLKINKAPMSWEHSNKWSGGEKWSKNMTLFLGILNYLAEKKQHLTANQKRNRTVILDNPFGKASSKHVLDPVFYIAERLGFQIIALTAHAEGQFISDYFPVVYSLRLRETKHENKLLMTGERVLNYTYLKEKAPASISRLQEAKQLDIFMS